MNVTTIDIDPFDATKKLKAYRSRKHKDAEKEYAAVISMLEAAEDGATFINVGDAITTAPRDEKGRPKLAIARADRKEVLFTWSNFPSTYTFDCAKSRSHRTETLTKAFTRPNLPSASYGYATVPMVPADVRPEKGQLKDWHILFEVERWHDRSVVDPPVDPMLLEHFEGEFYKVITEWELTDIERAAMRLAISR